MKKYDIITDYCQLECGPDGTIPTDLVSSGDEELDRKNSLIIQARWPILGQQALEHLRAMRRLYDFTTNFAPTGLRAKLMLADSDLARDPNWEVSFTVLEDGYSEWGVSFIDSAIDPDSSQPYF